jgi:hypothetical protein
MHRKFWGLLLNPSARGLEVCYELLVTMPKEEVRRIADFVEFEFDPRMLKFYNENFSICRALHLSMNRITRRSVFSRLGICAVV